MQHEQIKHLSAEITARQHSKIIRFSIFARENSNDI